MPVTCLDVSIQVKINLRDNLLTATRAVRTLSTKVQVMSLLMKCCSSRLVWLVYMPSTARQQKSGLSHYTPKNSLLHVSQVREGKGVRVCTQDNFCEQTNRILWMHSVARLMTYMSWNCAVWVTRLGKTGTTTGKTIDHDPLCASIYKNDSAQMKTCLVVERTHVWMNSCFCSLCSYAAFTFIISPNAELHQSSSDDILVLLNREPTHLLQWYAHAVKDAMCKMDPCCVLFDE